MEHAVQAFAAVSLLVIGLSHLFQPMAWIRYYQWLAQQGIAGAFTEGFLILSFGAIIVGFHNVWHGPAIGLTLVGWSQVAKGLVRFLAPEVTLGVMRRATPERAWYFRVGGVLALTLSAYAWWLRIAV